MSIIVCPPAFNTSQDILSYLGAFLLLIAFSTSSLLIPCRLFTSAGVFSCRASSASSLWGKEVFRCLSKCSFHNVSTLSPLNCFSPLETLDKDFLGFLSSSLTDLNRWWLSFLWKWSSSYKTFFSSKIFLIWRTAFFTSLFSNSLFRTRYLYTFFAAAILYLDFEYLHNFFSKYVKNKLFEGQPWIFLLKLII